MRKRTYVRTHGDGNSLGELLAKVAHVQIEDFLLALPRLGTRCMGCKILLNGKCGHRENMLLMHQTHSLVAELKGVFNGFDTGLCRIQRPGLASGVYRDVFSNASSFVYRSAEFGFGVLVGSG